MGFGTPRCCRFATELADRVAAAPDFDIGLGRRSRPSGVDPARDRLRIPRDRHRHPDPEGGTFMSTDYVAGAPARAGSRTWGEIVTAVLGAVYLAVGVAGFFVTAGVGVADTEGSKLLGLFEVNPLHNVVHLGIGAALVVAYLAGRKAVGIVATFIAAVYLVVGVIGPFVTGTEANILALNSLDHALHLGSAAVLLAAGINASRAAHAS
jgi:hypothetical protein